MYARSVGALDNSRIRDGALFVGGLVFAVVLHVVGPSEETSGPVCPFYAMTGLYCPGCGTLRCLHSLLHADVGSAFDYNAVTVSCCRRSSSRGFPSASPGSAGDLRRACGVHRLGPAGPSPSGSGSSGS